MVELTASGDLRPGRGAAARGTGRARPTAVTRIDHAAGARKADVELDADVLLIFGNVRVGTPLMQADPRVGIELPLRMLIWQDPDRSIRLPRPPRAGRPLCPRRPPADARAAERGAHQAGRRGGRLSARPPGPDAPRADGRGPNGISIRIQAQLLHNGHAPLYKSMHQSGANQGRPAAGRATAIAWQRSIHRQLVGTAPVPRSGSAAGARHRRRHTLVLLVQSARQPSFGMAGSAAGRGSREPVHIRDAGGGATLLDDAQSPPAVLVEAGRPVARGAPARAELPGRRSVRGAGIAQRSAVGPRRPRQRARLLGGPWYVGRHQLRRPGGWPVPTSPSVWMAPTVRLPLASRRGRASSAPPASSRPSMGSIGRPAKTVLSLAALVRSSDLFDELVLSEECQAGPLGRYAHTALTPAEAVALLGLALRASGDFAMAKKGSTTVVTSPR